MIGLGSNLGDRWAQLRAGVRGVAEFGTVVAVSTDLETDAVGGPPQGPFLNAALRLSTNLGLEELLAALLGLERAAGRQRRVRWGPRTLDLDLLWAGDRRSEEPHLQVPHPRLLERPFALIPLVEVAPEARDPRSGTTYLSVVETTPLGGLRRASGSGPWCHGFPSEIMTFRVA